MKKIITVIKNKALINKNGMRSFRRHKCPIFFIKVGFQSSLFKLRFPQNRKWDFSEILKHTLRKKYYELSL